MTPEQFAYWLQGFLELRPVEEQGMTQEQVIIIQYHLKQVFSKKTPNRKGLPHYCNNPKIC